MRLWYHANGLDQEYRPQAISPWGEGETAATLSPWLPNQLAALNGEIICLTRSTGRPNVTENRQERAEIRRGEFGHESACISYTFALDCSLGCGRGVGID